MALFEDGDGVSANDILQGQLDSGVEVATVGVHHVFDKLNEHLGVGLATEGHAILFQLGAKSLVVLDDAVVHQREVLGLGEVGVGVGGVGFAMSGPAGVGNADGATDILVLNTFFQC